MSDPCKEHRWQAGYCLHCRYAASAAAEDCKAALVAEWQKVANLVAALDAATEALNLLVSDNNIGHLDEATQDVAMWATRRARAALDAVKP